MYVYEVAGQDRRIRYIGTASNSDNAKYWLLNHYVWIYSETWNIFFAKVKDYKEAKKLKEGLIAKHKPTYNDIPPNAEPLPDPKWTGVIRDVNFLEGFPPERRGSARANILAIAAMSQGLVDKRVCSEICGSEVYYKKTMRNFKDSKEAETVFSKGPHTLHILPEGVKTVEPLVPGTSALWDANRMTRQGVARKIDISVTLYIMQLIGAEIYPTWKPELMDGNFFMSSEGCYGYSPYELKNQGREGLKGSRCTGLIIENNSAFFLYHMGSRNMVFPVTRELRAMAVVKSMAGNKLVKSAVMGTMDMLEEILKNGALKVKVSGSSHVDKITPDLNMTFIPIDDFKTAAIHIKLWMHSGEKLEGIVSRVRESTGLETLCALPLGLGTLNRLAHEKGEIAVVCSTAQAPYIKKICPTATVRSIKNDRLIECCD